MAGGVHAGVEHSHHQNTVQDLAIEDRMTAMFVSAIVTPAHYSDSAKLWHLGQAFQSFPDRCKVGTSLPFPEQLKTRIVDCQQIVIGRLREANPRQGSNVIG